MTRASTHLKGYYRDQIVLGLLDKLTVLDTHQILSLACPEISYELGCRKLRNLHKQKRLKRERFSMNEPYFYYLEKRPKRIEHRLGVNWVYVYLWLQQELGSVKLHSFQIEPREYEPIVEPDGFAVLKYNLKDSFYFIEFDRAESGNQFEKFHNYDRLFKKLFDDRLDGKKSYWWINLDKEQTFNLIIVTTGKKERINNIMFNQKQYGYRVEIMTLEEIKVKCTKLAQQLKDKILEKRGVINGR